MKPTVPSVVPYLDMRSWQQLGAKLRGQHSRRVSGMPSREATRNLPARRREGTRDGWVQPTYGNVRRSVVTSDKPHVLGGLNQTVRGQVWSSFSGPSWTHRPPAYRTGSHHPDIHVEQGKPLTLPTTAGEPQGTR